MVQPHFAALELCRAPPPPLGFYLFRFIDDGLISHPAGTANIVFTFLRQTYPANLTFSFDR